MSNDPAHQLGPTVRILVAVIDAVIAYGSLTDEALGQIDSVILREHDERRGKTQTNQERLMADLGVKDQFGIYAAAGLTDFQTKIAFLYWDQLWGAPEIGKFLHREPVNIQAQIDLINLRLLRLVVKSPNR